MLNATIPDGIIGLPHQHRPGIRAASGGVIRVTEQGPGRWALFNAWAPNEVFIRRDEWDGRTYRVHHRYNGSGICRAFPPLPFERALPEGGHVVDPVQTFADAFALARQLLLAYTPAEYRGA